MKTVVLSCVLDKIMQNHKFFLSFGMGYDGRISGLTRQTVEYVCRIPSEMTEKHSFLEKFLQKHNIFVYFIDEHR